MSQKDCNYKISSGWHNSMVHLWFSSISFSSHHHLESPVRKYRNVRRELNGSSVECKCCKVSHMCGKSDQGFGFSCSTLGIHNDQRPALRRFRTSNSADSEFARLFVISRPMLGPSPKRPNA